MPLNPQDRAELVRLARAAVEAKVRNQPLPTVGDVSGVLAERRGCFVTLTNEGHLRGCIGTFQPDRPLGPMVVEMGAAAAHDPRFVYNRIQPGELSRLKIDVSVLSPLMETAEPEKLLIGTHGIYITDGLRAGCFLPEVATDMGWSAEEFLDQCCNGKAGMPPGTWRKTGVQVYLFTSEKFSE